jgi:hypothetical protein
MMYTAKQLDTIATVRAQGRQHGKPNLKPSQITGMIGIRKGIRSVQIERFCEEKMWVPLADARLGRVVSYSTVTIDGRERRIPWVNATDGDGRHWIVPKGVTATTHDGAYTCTRPLVEGAIWWPRSGGSPACYATAWEVLPVN